MSWLNRLKLKDALKAVVNALVEYVSRKAPKGDGRDVRGRRGKR